MVDAERFGTLGASDKLRVEVWVVAAPCKPIALCRGEILT